MNINNKIHLLSIKVMWINIIFILYSNIINLLFLYLLINYYLY